MNSILNIKDGCRNIDDDFYFLGFHSYKEVVFLELPWFEEVAYHLNSSKVQYRGKLRPKDYVIRPTNGIYESFPYTPCMIGELSNSASSRRLGSLGGEQFKEWYADV